MSKIRLIDVPKGTRFRFVNHTLVGFPPFYSWVKTGRVMFSTDSISFQQYFASPYEMCYVDILPGRYTKPLDDFFKT